MTKFIQYDSEQAKILFKGVDTDNLKVINIAGNSIYINVSKKILVVMEYIFTVGKNLYAKRLQIIKNKLIVISTDKKYKKIGYKQS